MAEKMIRDIKLQLKVETGMDMDTGKAIYSTRTFPAVQPSLDIQDVYDAVQLLVGLQKHPLSEIGYIEVYEVIG